MLRPYGALDIPEPSMRPARKIVAWLVTGVWYFPLPQLVYLGTPVP